MMEFGGKASMAIQRVVDALDIPGKPEDDASDSDRMPKRVRMFTEHYMDVIAKIFLHEAELDAMDKCKEIAAHDRLI